jgi:hypothetical protein
MKKFYSILGAILLSMCVLAQTPQKMSYQAVIRNNSNQLLTNHTVGMRISILQGTEMVVYTETQTPTTNENGLVSIEIGGPGFNTIDWANGSYFIKTETDPRGGAKYTITGTSQLLSVPYALNAKTVESVDISKITGILGSQTINNFPDVINNKVILEINGNIMHEKVLIVNAIGHETERISTPMGFDSWGKMKYWENAGLTMEFPLIFETDNAEDIIALKAWYDEDPRSSKDMSIVIQDLAGNEAGRWNFYSYKPVDYETASNTGIRFTFQASSSADNKLDCKYMYDFGQELSFNPTTDKIVEIYGASLGEHCAPKFEIDTITRTITLTFDYLEGYQIYSWIKKVVTGAEGPVSVSVIETAADRDLTEISRMNYYECVPIRYEQFTGFGLNTKLKARVVIAYGFREIA